MNHYIDIQLVPDAELPAPVLMNAVFIKLHRGLCDLGSNAIGVSFPNQNGTLGNRLRLHGDVQELNNLMGLNWIGPMAGYCQVSEIQEAPSGVSYRTVSRKQTNMSQAKLKRLRKRGSITEDQARDYKAKMFSKGLDNPYLELQSASNGHRHRRYIEFGEIQDHPVSGEFDSFGLSKTATIPWF
jgi:CRISPR-associated endonuclease Csy4